MKATRTKNKSTKNKICPFCLYVLNYLSFYPRKTQQKICSFCLYVLNYLSFYPRKTQQKICSFCLYVLNHLSFYPRKHQQKICSFCLYVLNHLSFCPKTKTRISLLSDRASLLFHFNCFFYFEPDCGFRLTASNHSLTSNCVT